MTVSAGRRAPVEATGAGKDGEALFGPLVTDRKPRCAGCGRVLAWLVSRPWRIRCVRCRRTNGAEPGDPFPFGAP